MEKDKGFRDGKKDELREKVKDRIFNEWTDEHVELIDNMNEGDFKQIKDQKKYFDLTSVSPLMSKVLLQNDNFRRNRDKLKLMVSEKLIEIMDLKASIKRHNLELASGKIESEIRPGVPMTSEEMDVLIEREKRQCKVSAYDIVLPLNDMMAYVGCKDMAKNVVISKDDYESYVQSVVDKMKELGYDIFDDVL